MCVILCNLMVNSASGVRLGASKILLDGYICVEVLFCAFLQFDSIFSGVGLVLEM